MKRAGVRVGTGTRFVYDGEVIEIVELHCVGGVPDVVARHVRSETVCRLSLNELMFSPGRHQQHNRPDQDQQHNLSRRFDHDPVQPKRYR
jgi:hypothetical protein